MAGEKCVVVGAGGIFNAWIGPLTKEEVRVAAIVDLRIEAAQKRVEEGNLKTEASTDLKAMLARHKPHFVADLTVPEAHCAVTTTALKAGFHVIGEKPMASSMAEARKMVAAAEAAKKLYMVSQSRRWNPKHDQVRRTVTGRKIGRLTTINCDFYIGAHFGGFRDEMPSPLILDMAIHHFDMCRYMTGAEPVAVYAKEFNPAGSWYKGDVAATCVFEMSDGVVFTYRGSWCAEGCHTSWDGDWRIIGDKGALIYAAGEEPRGEVVAGKEGFMRPKTPLKVARSPMKFTGMHGALREMLQFLRTGAKPQTECHDNIRSLAMVFAAVESAKKGRRVEIRV